MTMTYPCNACNRDDGYPICLGDERCQRTDGVRTQRLMDAVEGECSGLAISRETAREVLRYVDTGLPPDETAAATDPGPAQRPGDLLAWGSQAVLDVAAERRRQIEAEGWTPEHDDAYRHGDMSTAAACYAMMGRHHFPTPGSPPPQWPWDAAWWKPSSYRRNLVKAAALLLAEIERLDRKA